jgi:hypothetical protein
VPRFRERPPERREGSLRLLGPLAERGLLRQGLTPDGVADIVFTVASPDTRRSLVDVCGWSPQKAQSWVIEQLRRELLPEPRAA